MKWSKWLGVVILIEFMALAGVLFFFFSNKSVPELRNSSGRDTLYYGLVAGNINQPLWQDIYGGALQYAEENHISVQLFGPDYFDLNEHIKWVRTAAACRLDGLIFPAYADEPYSGLIDEIRNRGIPVVTVMYDQPASLRDSYVGIDPEELGEAAALLLDNATGGRGQIAVLKNSPLSGDGNSILREPIVRGLVQAVDKSPNLRVVRAEAAPFGIFSAEEISRSLIIDHPEINAYFCDSVNTTLGLTQMVVDLNKVGQISIVGFMRNDDIDSYLAKGIIDGIIHTDSYEIGRAAVSILHDLSLGKQVQPSVKIGFSLLFSPGNSAE